MPLNLGEGFGSRRDWLPMDEPTILQFPGTAVPLPQFELGQFYTLLRTEAGRQSIRIHQADGSTVAVIGDLTDRQAEQYVRRLEEAGLERAGENSTS